MIVQVVLNGLIAGLLYALVALGFSLIYSGAKVFHIAHGAVYASAAYFLLAWNLIPGMPLPLSILLALGSACVLAGLFEILAYRPLARRNASILVTFISSLGLYIITVHLIAIFFGNEPKVINPSIEPVFTLAGIIVTQIQLIQLVTAGLLVTLMLFLLRSTSFGRNIRALSDNSNLASVLGVKVSRVRLQIFVIGSLLAASAALLRAFEVGVDPHIGLSAVLTAAVAVIIGGVGAHGGAVVAAVLIGIVQGVVIWYSSAQWQEAVTFVILIGVLLIRSEGIFSVKLRLEER